jgi:hypothetical protein
LRAHLGLTAAEVIIADNTKGSAPISVVQYAERRVREQGGYDHVYCVFDRDDHESYGRALERIARRSGRAAKRLNISAVASRPCFEVWVLLHFERTDRPFEDCEEVVARIRRGHIPAYRKADVDVQRLLMSRTDEAIRNANWLAAQAAITGGYPGTSVHLLAQHLKNSNGGKAGAC